MYRTQLKTTPLGGRAWRSPRRPDQVDPIVTAASLELTDEDINEIEANQVEVTMMTAIGFVGLGPPMSGVLTAVSAGSTP